MRDVDRFVRRYGARACGPRFFFRYDVPEPELEWIDSGILCEQGVAAMARGKREWWVSALSAFSSWEVDETEAKSMRTPAMLDPDQARMRLAIYLEEYRMLKYEQVHRIEIRDNIVNASLIVTGAVIAFSFRENFIPFALLALPVANFVLGWLHTTNDAKSCSIAHYLHHVLSERLSKFAGSEYPELTETHPSILGWEDEVRHLPLRRERKFTDLVAAVFTFVVPGLVAVMAYWGWFHEQDPQPSSHLVLYVASGVDFALLSVLCVWLWKDRDFC